MGAPERRVDAYGRPVQQVVEVHREVLLEREHNQVMRRLLRRLLDEQAELLLRRGTHAVVTLRFTVKDGMIAGELVTVTVENQHRQEGREG